jgi:hypothetical protein
LLDAAEARLAQVGARRWQAAQADPAPMGFWRQSGWEEQTDRVRFVKE